MRTQSRFVVRVAARFGVPAICAVLALGAAGCATGDASDEINVTPEGVKLTAGGSDSEGSVYMGAVKVVRIDRSTMNADGKVQYVVENVSGADQEDLLWSVSYVFPRGSDDSELISMPQVEETTLEKALVLLRGEKDKKLDAVCRAFAERRAKGQQITGTHLNVASNPPVLTTARDAEKGLAGTRLGNGRIECVTNKGAGDEITLEFENVTPSVVPDLEVQLVFTQARDRARARSKWKVIPSMAPGARSKVVIDITGLDVQDRSFLVKVRDQSM